MRNYYYIETELQERLINNCFARRNKVTLRFSATIRNKFFVTMRNKKYFYFDKFQSKNKKFNNKLDNVKKLSKEAQQTKKCLDYAEDLNRRLNIAIAKRKLALGISEIEEQSINIVSNNAKDEIEIMDFFNRVTSNG
jgi:hypothetical protein